MSEHDVAGALVVNGMEMLDPATVPSDETLLETLRERLGFRSVKRGCDRGECGTCTVLVGGNPVMACLMLTARCRQPVETAEGMEQESVALRAAFADRGAFQCGYCTPAQVVTGVHLLRTGVPSSPLELRKALSGNVCRCTGYQQIAEAICQVDQEGESG